MNQHDSDIMKGLFQNAGYQIIDFTEEADVYVINTCTVTHLSDRKSRQMIRRAAHQNPNAVIAVCGCYVQASPEEVAALEEVDLILGTNERHQIVEAVENFMRNGEKRKYLPSEQDLKHFEEVPKTRVTEMTRAYLKVQEGCEQFCAYCIIPYARGPLRSRPLVDVVESVRQLEAQGYKEVILTGIHLGAYGLGEDDEPSTLYDLCRTLINKTGMERIRLSSIEPTEVNDQLIELMAQEPRMARHLHIPLQCGDDDILEAMNRPYRQKEFRDRVEKIRAAIPDIAITTDLMVGFPGEDETHFQNSLDFVKEMNFSGMHIFKYSPRSGTPAAEMKNQVSPEDKDRYSKKMHEVANQNAERYARNYIGKTVEVLLEEKQKEYWTGHTSNYLRVYASGEGKRDEMAKVVITDYKDKALYGKIK